MNVIRECWIDGRGWVPYPILVIVPRRMVFYEWDRDFLSPDTDSPVVEVHIGPAAPLPRKINVGPPRQDMNIVPHCDLQYPQWKSFYASKIIDPRNGCAWLYELGPEIDGHHVAIWKVWDYPDAL